MAHVLHTYVSETVPNQQTGNSGVITKEDMHYTLTLHFI